MKVYIAGPMTGKALFNFPAFDHASAQWRDAGWDVVSPADLTREYWREHFGEEFDPANTDPRISAGGDIYREFMRKDIAAISTCDAIALLPGWEKSSGVAKELTAARLLALQELDAVTFAPMARPAPESVLQEAQRLVYGDREAAYSHPFDDFQRIARMWSGYLDGVKITPQDVAQLMVLLKVARVRVDVVHNRRPKRDTLVDIAGYSECGYRVSEREVA